MVDQSVPEGLHPVEEPMLEQFMKNYSPWEGLTLEKFVEDCHFTGGTLRCSGGKEQGGKSSRDCVMK